MMSSSDHRCPASLSSWPNNRQIKATRRGFTERQWPLLTREVKYSSLSHSNLLIRQWAAHRTAFYRTTRQLLCYNAAAYTIYKCFPLPRLLCKRPLWSFDLRRYFCPQKSELPPESSTTSQRGIESAQLKLHCTGTCSGKDVRTA